MRALLRVLSRRRVWVPGGKLRAAEGNANKIRMTYTSFIISLPPHRLAQPSTHTSRIIFSLSLAFHVRSVCVCVWSHPLACGASDVSTFYSAGAAAVAGKYTKYSTYKNRTDSDVKERTRSLVRLFPHIVVSSPVTVNPIDPPEQPSTNAETTHTHTQPTT